mgnify:CR=1 FL=1
MKVDDMTIGEARELSKLFCCPGSGDGPWKVGTPMLIRTVTNYWTGRIVEIHSDALVLNEAAWIADTGRFSEALQNGIETLSNSEIEPVPDRVIVSRGSIIDAVVYSKTLPRSKK